MQSNYEAIRKVEGQLGIFVHYPDTVPFYSMDPPEQISISVCGAQRVEMSNQLLDVTCEKCYKLALEEKSLREKEQHGR